MDFENVKFESERLSFNRIQGETHGEEVNATVCDTLETLKPWMSWAKEKPTVQDTINGLRTMTDNFTDYVFAIYPKGLKTLIGTIRLTYVRQNNEEDKAISSYEIGYWLHKDYYKKGLGTESAKRVIEYACTELKADRLILLITKANVASARVAEKCGFSFVKEYEITESDRPDWGIYVDVMYERISVCTKI